MDQRKILSHQIVADDAVEIRTEPLRQMLRRLRQFFRSHIVRRRIDEVAGQRGCFRHPCDLGDVDAARGHQSDLRHVCLAVAAEAIAAECEGKRGEARIMRRIAEAVDARRQQARQQTGPEQVAELDALVLQPEHDLCDLAVRGWQGQTCSGFGCKSIGQRELPRRRGKFSADCVPCRLGRKCNGNSGRCGFGFEH